ncbi:PLP-dependent aminotransferase family protein [Paenibacillus aurantiacus]|uniref:PLP-dependent aminotransferase family protein n=1 Tax=Paenibacillus aurantiacus TaxID=1936118 RepID=A0ABV5KW51_9BACL
MASRRGMAQAEIGSRRANSVYETIRSGIKERKWLPGGKLPSVREMGERMEVHRLTVLKAYRQLAEEGIIEAKYKSGYYVKSHSMASSESLHAGDWDYKARSLYVNRSRLSDIHRQQVDYQMSEALIDPNLLPNAYLSNYVKQVFDLYPRVLSTYSTVLGDPELREELACFFLAKHGISVHPDELLITTGSQQAIDLVSRALAKPGDKALIERPTYSPAIDAFHQQGITLLPVEIAPEGYDLDEVERFMKTERPRLFYMNPTYQNPTGYTVPAAQRKRLVELAEKYQCLLVEDDVYHDIYFGSPPPPPLFYYDTEGYVLYIRSFSKYVAPGLRISVLAARPALMEAIAPVKALSDNGTPLLNQKIFQHYFFSTRLQEHVVKLRTALELRKTAMESQLADTGWHWASPEGGLNLWLRLPRDIPVDELLRRALSRSIAFVPGSICDPLGGMNDRMRLSYSYLNEGKLAEGVHRLIAIADEIRVEHRFL